jgi:methylated-DNA-[protein]-cysteine S-methyltransferase
VMSIERRLNAPTTELDAAAIDRVRALVAHRAQDRGLLDIAYRTIDTPVGHLLIAATPEGLIRIAYPREDHDFVLTQLADKVSPRVLNAPARLDAAARQLDEYFTASRQRFDLALDLRLAHGFRRTVLEHLVDVPYGQTVSYARAVRAVGTACATNPLPVVIPCHRVIRSDGALGAYVGGSDVKQTLVNLERADASPTAHLAPARR